MNRNSLLELHEQLCNEARQIMQAKNHDYSGGKDLSDPFLNFTRVERLGVTETNIGFLVRLVDKLSRLITHAKNNQFAVSESLKDTVLDVMNYMILYYAYNVHKELEKLNPSVDFHDTGDEDE